MSETVKAITDANFDTEVLNSSIPIIVDFWAPWCGPCKQSGPIFEALAADPSYEGKIHFGKCNVDDNTEIPAKFGIRGIPTLLVFKKGEVADTKVGASSASELRQFIDLNL